MGHYNLLSQTEDDRCISLTRPSLGLPVQTRRHLMRWRHFRPQSLKVAERYRFHSAVQRQDQSIADFIRELKKLAGTCEFTNEQLNLRDRFICGLRSQQVKQKLLSRNFTFQEALNEAFVVIAKVFDGCYLNFNVFHRNC